MADNEQVKKVLPSVFAEAVYKLDGSPFRLTNRHYLKPIYNGQIEEGIIMSGRQVEKSTTNSGGTWESYKNYSLTVNNTVYEDLGDYFENFICKSKNTQNTGRPF